jgi:hypothetical protein
MTPDTASVLGCSPWHVQPNGVRVSRGFEVLDGRDRRPQGSLRSHTVCRPRSGTAASLDDVRRVIEQTASEHRR